jgi:hypothetical protein
VHVFDEAIENVKRGSYLDSAAFREKADKFALTLERLGCQAHRDADRLEVLSYFRWKAKVLLRRRLDAPDDLLVLLFRRVAKLRGQSVPLFLRRRVRALLLPGHSPRSSNGAIACPRKGRATSAVT